MVGNQAASFRFGSSRPGRRQGWTREPRMCFVVGQAPRHPSRGMCQGRVWVTWVNRTQTAGKHRRPMPARGRAGYYRRACAGLGTAERDRPADRSGQYGGDEAGRMTGRAAARHASHPTSYRYHQTVSEVRKTMQTGLPVLATVPRDASLPLFSSMRNPTMVSVASLAA
jgi:hypothetical protein